ncbi:glycosyltransferase family 4 protein [Mucilaginibacter sp.]|uniref:glycosyltransferase family 4 protein n=1 Tax=Mucilaginibacter sp. TaxID=1882438 RepID=UPI0035BBB7CA
MQAISGYDALYDHFPAGIKVESVFCNFQKRYPRGIGRMMEKSAALAGGPGFYNAQSLEAEMRLLWKAGINKYDLVHYAYGESYFGIGRILKKRLPVFVTNHQPVSWWERHTGFAARYANASKVITLSEHDRDYFNILQPGKAVCIPHGVNTKFYRPDTAAVPSGPFNVLFVGRYLRDTVALCRTVNNLRSLQPDIRFDVVYADRAGYLQTGMQELAKLPEVNWHTGVSAEALRGLYSKADCCLIPLEDSTANNAILEAMACGTPVVTTNLPAVHTYLDETSAMFARPKNSDDLTDLVLSLYREPGKKSAMGKKAREKAVRDLDWEVIALKTFDLFNSYHD